jgi:hypothetical protein
MKTPINVNLNYVLVLAALLFMLSGAAPPQSLRRNFNAGPVPAESDAIRLPVGSMMIWQDRGPLTPSRVYFGRSPMGVDPLSRVPTPPFSHFEPDDKDKSATSPKAKLTDSNGVEWIAKFGYEVHSDTIAPRLAWALGFGAVEGYYVPAGKIGGIGPDTKLRRLKGSVLPDGSFSEGARFKRHNSEDQPLKDSKGNDMTWDESRNPGVPPEQLSGLMIFEVLVCNWDTQPKNCKVYRIKGPHGPENWYIVSDMGATFARPPRKFVLADYAKSTGFVRSVSANEVQFDFVGVIPSQAKLHRRVPLAHAQWFRKQLVKLTDGQILAAFDAGFATDGLNRAYASGDEETIREVRNRELSAETRSEISGYAAALRARINEFLKSVPE